MTQGHYIICHLIPLWPHFLLFPFAVHLAKLTSFLSWNKPAGSCPREVSSSLPFAWNVLPLQSRMSAGLYWRSPFQQGLPGPLNIKFHPMFPLTMLVIVISQQHFFFLDWACVTTQHNVFYLFMLFIGYLPTSLKTPWRVGFFFLSVSFTAAAVS